MSTEHLRPFRCDYPGCNKVFNRRDYLERHSTNHLEVKPFVCYQCNRSFSRKDLYDNHLTTKRHARLVEQAEIGVSEAGLLIGDESHHYIKPLPEMSVSVDQFSLFKPLDGSQRSAGSPQYSSDDLGTSTHPEVPHLDLEYEHATATSRSQSTQDQPFSPISPVDGFDCGSIPFRVMWSSPLCVESARSSLKRSYESNNDIIQCGLPGIHFTGSGIYIPTDTMSVQSTQQLVQNRLNQDEWRNSQIVDVLREVACKSRLMTPSEPSLEYHQPTPNEGDILARGNGDSRYEWFFDDSYFNERAKYGYDRFYSKQTQELHEHLVEYRQKQQIHESNLFQSQTRAKLLPSKAESVLHILREVPQHYFNDLSVVDQYMELAWARADAVSYIVHSPSHNPNETHIALLAVLMILGLALSADSEAKALAKTTYPSVFLYTYETLATDSLNTRYEPAQIGHLQAFCLLLRYESVILSDDLKLSLTRYRTGRHIVDRFLWTVLGAVPHLKLVPGCQYFNRTNRRTVWATISPESYLFHQGADPEAQWREWLAYEMCKRTVHFAVYCDSIQSLSWASNCLSPVSIFNLDIHMICPDGLWQARTADEFFFVAGCSRLVSNVPFLGLIKSLIRFPRISVSHPPPTGARGAGESSQNKQPWSLFALRMAAYGLITIVGRFSGLFKHGDSMLQALMKGTAIPSAVLPVSRYTSSFFDRQIQARLYRGLDIWFQYFEEAYGKVTERLFNIGGAMGLRISEEFAVASDPCLDSDTLPEYALILILFHYSSFIFVHEDLPIVLQVTSSLRQWIATPEGSQHQPLAQKALLDYLYMPLFIQWIQTEDARTLISTSALYLTWVKAASGQVRLAHNSNHLFLSAVTYIAVIVVWLHDLAAHKGTIDYTPLEVKDLAFMDEAVQYLRIVHLAASREEDLPSQRPIPAIVLGAACMLHKRAQTQPLVEMLVNLLRVMVPHMTVESISEILDKSTVEIEHRKAV